MNKTYSKTNRLLHPCVIFEMILPVSSIDMIVHHSAIGALLNHIPRSFPGEPKRRLLEPGPLGPQLVAFKLSLHVCRTIKLCCSRVSVTGLTCEIFSSCSLAPNRETFNLNSEKSPRTVAPLEFKIIHQVCCQETDSPWKRKTSF